MPRLHLCECTAPTLQEDMVEGGAELGDVVRDEGEDLGRLILAAANVLAEVECVGLAHLPWLGHRINDIFLCFGGQVCKHPEKRHLWVASKWEQRLDVWMSP